MCQRPNPTPLAARRKFYPLDGTSHSAVLLRACLLIGPFFAFCCVGSTVSQLQHALCALARSELEALKTYFGNKDEARSTKQKSNCGNTDEAKAFLLLHIMWCCSCSRERLLELLDTPRKGNMSTVKTILTCASSRTISR